MSDTQAAAHETCPVCALETELDGWATVEEAGRYLLLTYRQVLDRIGEGRLRARKVGSKYLIEVNEVLRYDRARRAGFQVMPDGSGQRGDSQL